MVEGRGVVQLSPNKHSKGTNNNMKSQMTQTTVICLLVTPAPQNSHRNITVIFVSPDGSHYGDSTVHVFLGRYF